MNGRYRLDGHNPVPVDDLMEWARWMEGAERHVGNTEEAGVRVSTVFLGLDSFLRNEGPALLFETMVFGGEHDQDIDRYSTWEEAEAGHKRMCEKVLGRGPREDNRS